jgi:VWFA-related protein
MRTLLAVFTCTVLLGAQSDLVAQTAPAADGSSRPAGQSPGGQPPQGQAAPGQTSPSTPAAPAPGQPAPAAEPPVQGPTFRTGVEIIAVDVGVVDRRGRPVEDLRAPDFVVKVNGEVRRVASAELVKTDVEADRKAVAADRDAPESFYTSNLTPPSGRQIVIAVVQVNIQPGSLRPVMAAAKRFLDKLSPLDQVSFVAYPEPGPRVSFTTDRLKVKLAMDSLIGAFQRTQVGQYNIGVSEALTIADKRDQIVLAGVVARECPSTEPQRRAACERDIVSESSQIAKRMRDAADESLVGLRQVLERLIYVDGPKSLILISEGLAIDDPSDLDLVIRLAGQARTSINVLVVDLQRGDVTIAEQPATELQDRRLQTQGLEALAILARGSLFQVVGTGEPIFDRLASEISAYYLLGVEQRPGDAERERNRIDVEVRRRDVTIRSRQAFVLSPNLLPKRSLQDQLRDAISSPFAVSGVPLRVTTFARQDPASDKVQLTVAAQVGAPGAKPANVTIGYVIIDDQNRVVADYVDTRTLSPIADSPNEPLGFIGGAMVDPGVYSLRFAVVDAEGRRGSIVRDVNAWKLRGEELALGDLVVGNVPGSGQALRAAVEPYVTGETMAMYLELYSTTAGTWTRSSVSFEVADNETSPALATLPAQMTAGREDGWRVATGVIRARVLPPGRYVARAQIVRDGKMVGSLARPFVLERAVGEPSAIIPAAAVAEVSISFATSLPKFDREMVLSKDMVSSMLDLVQKRSPSLADAVTEARAGRYGPAAREALTSGDQETASFLRGLDLFTKGQLDQAATQLNLAAGPRREFFPGALYLGAAYAAVGRDRDAAGVWQMALGTEPRPAAVYLMVADARLRDGQPASAIDILKPVFTREPANVEVARRLGMAYMVTNRYAEALPVLDVYLSRQPTDQEALLAAIVAHYELRSTTVLSSVDRAKLRKYGTAYQGPQQALVEKYLATMQVR